MQTRLFFVTKIVIPTAVRRFAMRSYADCRLGSVLAFEFSVRKDALGNGFLGEPCSPRNVYDAVAEAVAFNELFPLERLVCFLRTVRRRFVAAQNQLAGRDGNAAFAKQKTLKTEVYDELLARGEGVFDFVEDVALLLSFQNIGGAKVAVPRKGRFANYPFAVFLCRR